MCLKWITKALIAVLLLSHPAFGQGWDVDDTIPVPEGPLGRVANWGYERQEAERATRFGSETMMPPARR